MKKFIKYFLIALIFSVIGEIIFSKMPTEFKFVTAFVMGMVYEKVIEAMR